MANLRVVPPLHARHVPPVSPDEPDPRLPGDVRIPLSTADQQDDEEKSSATEADLLHGAWYTTDELAAVLGIDASTLRRWRTSRPPQGPPFIEVAPRFYRYNATDVEAYLWAKRTDPTKSVA